MPSLYSIGSTVSMTTVSGDVFVGKFLGLRNDDERSIQGIPFFEIQLTTAVGSYTIGETVALNANLVVSIGPVFL